MTSERDLIRPATYQLVALTKLLTNGFNGLLVADGVGVGKTISSGYILLRMNKISESPSLVICPPSLVPKWLTELGSKFGLRVRPIRSPEDLVAAKRETEIGRGQRINSYVMASSQILRAKIHDFPAFSCVIFDEIHNYRNRETKSYSRARDIALLGERRIGLSATPINNSMDDLVSELAILLPDYQWESIQATVEEVWKSKSHLLTEPLITRFTKDRLKIHFARRMVETRSIKYDAIYSHLVKNLITKRHESQEEESSLYQDLTYYRLTASSPVAFAKSFGVKNPKVGVDHKIAALRRILASELLQKWIIYCGFRDTVEYLKDEIEDWDVYSLTGETPMFDRPSIIENFRRASRALLVMTEVGSEGLDLQFCNGVINYDIHWNPMRLEQRIGRIDRVGQTKEEIWVYNLIVLGSIDERVIRVLTRKLRVLEGSAFSTGALLGEYEEDESAAMEMYDQETLNHELQESKSLVTALKFTESLRERDYDVLPYILEEFCQPAKLRSASAKTSLPWLEQSATGVEWIERMKKSSSELQSLIHYYS